MLWCHSKGLNSKFFIWENNEPVPHRCIDDNIPHGIGGFYGVGKIILGNVSSAVSRDPKNRPGLHSQDQSSREAKCVGATSQDGIGPGLVRI